MRDWWNSFRLGSTLLLASAGALAAAACSNARADDFPARTVPGGDAARGKQAIVAYGCGSCHMVPGVDGANGLVGPPLTAFSRRTYVAGEVPNTADFLVRWIVMPQSIEPGTAMPNLGVTDGQARDIAAYLYTLH